MQSHANVYYAEKSVYDLNKAILAGNIEEVALQLEQFDPKNINAYDLKDALTKKRLIDCAVESGLPEMVTMILSLKPELEEPCESTGSYPIHAAVRNLDGEALEKILTQLYLAGANFRAKEKVTGFTLLHLAISENKEYLIEPLLTQCRCDINATDARFYTPLKMALDKHGSNDLLIDYLKENGAKEYSDATAELHDLFNKDYEKYLKYAKRYPVRFRSSYSHTTPENDDNNSKEEVTADNQKQEKPVSPLVRHSLYPKPVHPPVNPDKATIEPHVKAILNSAPEKLYEVFLKKLSLKDNKESLIEAIISSCEEKAATAKNQTLYATRIDELQQLKAAITHEVTNQVTTPKL